MQHDINFLPWRENLNRRRSKYLLIHYLLFLLVSSLSLFLLYWHLNVQVQRQTMRVNLLDDQLAKLEKVSTQLIAVQSDVKKKVDQLTWFEVEHKQRYMTIDLMNFILNVVPSGVYLDTIVSRNNKVTLTGYSEENQPLVHLLDNINASALIDNVNVNFIESNLKSRVQNRHPFFVSFSFIDAPRQKGSRDAH